MIVLEQEELVHSVTVSSLLFQLPKGTWWAFYHTGYLNILVYFKSLCIMRTTSHTLLYFLSSKEKERNSIFGSFKASLLFFFEGCPIVCRYNCLLTHGYNNLAIPDMAYYINDLDIQRSGRGRGRQTYSKVGKVLYKICPSHYANFQKKKKNLIWNVLWNVLNFTSFFM